MHRLLEHVGVQASGTLDPAPIQQHKNLCILPLLGSGVRALEYLTLDEALKSKVARVTEVSKGGSVPQLHLFNDGAHPVLLLDGEELVGSKQNRVLNLTILARPASAGGARLLRGAAALVLQFAGHVNVRSHPARLGRALKIRSVTMSMSSTGSRQSNQGEVWSSVSTSSVVLGVSSSTSSMAAIYEEHARRIDEYVAHLTPVPGQAEAICSINGEVMGVALFDTPETFAKLYPKLLRSYAVEALVGEPQLDAPTPEAICAWLTATVGSKVETYPAVGLGSDVRLERGIPGRDCPGG